MSNIQSYNAIINRFSAFAGGHYILKQFSHGMISTSDLEKFSVYPFMHVVPPNVSYEEGQKRMQFEIIFADLPRDKEDKTDYQKEVLSDLQKIAEDLIAVITNNDILFGSLISCENANITPFLEEYKHTLTGWKLSFDLIVPYYWDACDVPAEWNTFVTSNQSGVSSSLQFIESLNLDSNGNVSLDNDEESPLPNMYYGTDAEGVKGWQLLEPQGITCEDLPECQTIIDMNTEIGLKVNTDDLGPTAFSNDYNDLDNLPVIPAPVTSVSVVSHEVKLGSTMTKGTAVYVSSADGTNMIVSPASNTTEVTSSKTMGLLMEGGNNNAHVYVITEGLLDGLNTTSASIGDPVWLGNSGALLYGIANKPVAPLHMVFIGIVTRVNANNGEIFVKVQNGFELNEIHDVATAQSKTTPIDTDAVLLNDSADANGLWKKLSWSNIKTTLKTYFDSLYATITALNLKQDELFDFSTKKGIFIFDDMWYSQSSGSFLSNNLFWNASGGSQIVQSNTFFTLVPTTTQRGIALWRTQSSATSFIQFVIGQNSSVPSNTIFYLGNGKINFETYVLFPILSDATNRYYFHFGFTNNSTSATPQEYVSIMYNEGTNFAYDNNLGGSPNFTFNNSSSSVRTRTINSSAVAINTWYKLRIEVLCDSGIINFYVNDVLRATHNTNIPATTTRVQPFMNFTKTIGTTNREVAVDYVALKQDFSTLR